MKTTATYNPETQTFVLHTPDFQAAKCWAGTLGTLFIFLNTCYKIQILIFGNYILKPVTVYV